MIGLLLGVVWSTAIAPLLTLSGRLFVALAVAVFVMVIRMILSGMWVISVGVLIVRGRRS